MNDQQHYGTPWKRGQFIHAMAATAFVSVIPLTVFGSDKNNSRRFTVQEVIDLIIKDIPGSPFKETVDTIKSGDASQVVTGIVTTMFATIEVINKAIAAGANFIIAHEPVFYNHFDNTDWLENDPVYQYKTALLKKHKIAVWRCHDYIHSHKPDGVMTGVLTALGWEKYRKAEKPFVIDIPATSLQSIIGLSKQKLGIGHVRYIGNLSAMCSRIALLPGAASGKTQINLIKNEKPDLLIVGEVEEWETSEYIRDLQSSGLHTSLLVLGHIVSEEAGLEWLMKWLQERLPEVRTMHIASGDAFSWA